MNPKGWLIQFIRSLPEENKQNLRKHIKENVGIFNPGLYKSSGRVFS